MRNQLDDDGVVEDDRQQAVLERVAAEDVRDLAADDGTQAEVAQRPGRVLARRAATEVVAGDQDRGAGVLGPVERKIRVRPAVGEIAPVVERKTAKAFALRGREKARRDRSEEHTS